MVFGLLELPPLAPADCGVVPVELLLDPVVADPLCADRAAVVNDDGAVPAREGTCVSSSTTAATSEASTPPTSGSSAFQAPRTLVVGSMAISFSCGPADVGPVGRRGRGSCPQRDRG